MDVKLKNIVCSTIDKRSSDLKEISQKIWENPELGYEEFAAHDLLTTFLEKEGFNVSKKTPLETSFIARYGDSKGLKIGVLCEYDALPGIGHACGHNLIAEAGVGAALGIKSVLMHEINFSAEVIVFGTPAEEKIGGKIEMMKSHVFDEVDFCMMSHPTPYELPDPAWLAAVTLKMTFKGKPSHASAAPWEGNNALDAVVSFYTSVSMLRQQIKPTSRIHFQFVKAGEAINIIPDEAEMHVGIRGLQDSDVNQLMERVEDCAKGAAVATGCNMECTMQKFVSHVKTNSILIDLYIANAKSLGVQFCDDEYRSKCQASTDMGNVSQIKPSIHPLFKIKTEDPNHTHGFTKATGAEANQLPTLNSAKSMAMTAVDVFCNQNLLTKIIEDFDNAS